MMLNKFDFESGLKQDKAVFGGGGGLPLAFQNGGGQSKPNLFGPTPNLAAGGFVMNNEGLGSGVGPSDGKSKRDLLWEQKRKQKQDIINPPIGGGGGGGGASLLDQMNPASRAKMLGINLPPSSSNKNDFQKAISFDQPKPLIELPVPQLQQQPPRDIPLHQNNPSQQRLMSPIEPSPMNFQPPMQVKQKEASSNIWDKLQQQQQQVPPVGGGGNSFTDMQPMAFQKQSSFQQIDNSFTQQQQVPPFDLMGQGAPEYISKTQQQSYQSQQNLMQPQVSFDPAGFFPPNMPSSQPSYSQQQQQPQANPSQQQQKQLLNQMQEDKLKQKKEYLSQIQNEIKEKEEKKRREKEEKMRKEREELKRNMEYNPFGRGGAGAPIKDSMGNVVVTRKPAPGEQPQQMPQQRMLPQQQQQQNSYNQQFLPPQNIGGQADIYLHQPYQQQQQPIQPVGFSKGPQPMGMFSPQPQQQLNFDMPMLQAQVLPPQQIQLPIQQMQMPPPQLQLMGGGGGVGQSLDGFEVPMFNNFGGAGGGGQKMRAPDPALQFEQQLPPAIGQQFQAPQRQSMKQAAISDQEDDTAQGKGLGIGAFNELEKERQKNQKQELQSILKQQMEEQKKRKEEEQKRKKEEELREEERIRKERQKIEEEYKMEESKKKAKFSEVQQANAHIIQSKNVKGGKLPVVDEGGSMQNYVVEKAGQKPDIFGNGAGAAGTVILPMDEGMGGGLPGQPRMGGFDGGHPSNQISQTRIISEISSELKNNFKEEISKLRDEMNSQQRAFREQLERLKNEAVRSNTQKQDAMSEIERVKAEIKAQREAERLQEQRVLATLEKYDPNRPPAPMDLLNNYDRPGAQMSQGALPSAYPVSYQPQIPGGNNQMGSSFYNSKRIGSRQESRDSQRKREINNYEKMFFGGNEMGGKKSYSQSREDGERRPHYNIKEEKVVNFNQDYFQPAQNQFQSGPNGGAGGGARHEPKIMRRGESAINNIDFGASLNAESTLLPISQDSKRNRQDRYEDQQQQLQQQMMQPYGGPPSQQPSSYPSQKPPQFNPVYDDFSLNKENKQQPSQAPGGPSYLDHLNQLGAGDVRLNTESAEDTMDFINRIVSQKDKPIEEKYLSKNQQQKDDRMADKLDNFNFNFPQIPPYEGFQQKLMPSLEERNSKPPPSMNVKSTLQKDALNSFTPDIFAKNLGMGQPGQDLPTIGLGHNLGGHRGSIGLGGGGLSENTLNSLGTLNSLNLDKLNQRNEDRLGKLGLAFDQLDYTQNTQVNFGDNSLQISPDKPPVQAQRKFPDMDNPPQGSDGLKQVDSLLFDILRGNEGPNGGGGGGSQRYDPYGAGAGGGLNTKVNSSGGRIPHISSTNTYENYQKMRETRDMFMAPKMGQIHEDGGEDFEGTLKPRREPSGKAGIQLPTDMRHLDSLLDTTNLALN